MNPAPDSKPAETAPKCTCAPSLSYSRPSCPIHGYSQTKNFDKELKHELAISTPVPPVAEEAKPKHVLLSAWQEMKKEEERVSGVKFFLGFPDRWFEQGPKYVCQNRHISTRYLKSEVKGTVCLSCQCPLFLVPPETTQEELNRVLDGLPADPSAPLPCPFCGSMPKSLNPFVGSGIYCETSECPIYGNLIDPSEWNRRAGMFQASGEPRADSLRIIDAARYRFLRDKAFVSSPDCRNEFCKLADVHGVEFDAIVDREMKGEK